MSTTQIESKQQIQIGNFGDGRYSPVMGELFRDSQRLLGLSDKQAHTVSTRLGADLGRLSNAQAQISYGSKVSKDGLRTVKEVASLKITESTSITVAVLCAGLDKLRAQGLVVNDCGVSPAIMESINAMTEKLFA